MLIAATFFVDKNSNYFLLITCFGIPWKANTSCWCCLQECVTIGLESWLFVMGFISSDTLSFKIPLVLIFVVGLLASL